ncbi:MarR family transcriptional regulator [Streptomyces sp. NPDC000151]|uniref:MarR family winged helix-turn-helix transcriptional regulator n=1 Tax=Streptomyces sp. NPDC000151 TaxID=3154244 RepID=UPI0033185B53
MDTAASLSHLLGPLRRAVLRSTRTAEGLPDLPEAHIELLRVLSADGPLGTGAVAARLSVSPSTVSNLVRAMAAAGLVERRPSATDARSVGLSATPAALELLARYDRASTRALQEALHGLPPGDRAAVDKAIPALERLAASLGG